MPPSKLLLQDVVDLLGFAASPSLPVDDFLSIHEFPLFAAEEASVLSVIYVSDYAASPIETTAQSHEAFVFFLFLESLSGFINQISLSVAILFGPEGYRVPWISYGEEAIFGTMLLEA